MPPPPFVSSRSLASSQEDEYSEDEEEEEGVFLRIGRMTLSETQAKLYGLKKDPKKVRAFFRLGGYVRWGVLRSTTVRQAKKEVYMVLETLAPHAAPQYLQHIVALAPRCSLALTLARRAAQVCRPRLHSRGAKVQEEQAQRGKDGEDFQASEEVQLQDSPDVRVGEREGERGG